MPDTPVEQPEEQTVPLLVQELADAHPDATAIECGKDTLTYRRLWDDAGALAARLRRTDGFAPGCVVGVLCERGIPGIVAQLAAWRAGAGYLPLDPALPDGRIATVLADARPAAVLAQPDLSRRVPGGIPVLGAGAGAAAPAGEPEPAAPAGLAYVIYTSGSTGTPKGVEVGHASLANLVRWHRETYGTAPGVRVAAFAGLGFDASVWETWAALAAGATLVLPDEPPGADVSLIADFLAVNAVEQCFLSTPLAEQLLAHDAPPACLRVLLTGGDRLRVHPDPAFPAAVHNHYGPTEATVVTTASGDLRRTGADTGRAPVIGRPVTGARVRLTDADGGGITEPGVSGELLIGGAILALGYRGDPELTRRMFRTGAPTGRNASDGTSERWYASGDLCRWTSDGELEFVARRDAQLSVRGNRVEPAELEHAMLAVPQVTQAVAVLNDDGSGGSLAAFYTGAAEEPSVRSALADRLPGYMVPSRIQRLDTLPLTPNGKIDRAALTALPAPRAATGDAQGPTPGSTAEGIAEIWADLTGTTPGPRDSFFAIGGHSVLAARMIGRVRERFAVRLGLQAVFDNPVLADLAAAVDAAGQAARADEREG